MKQVFTILAPLAFLSLSAGGVDLPRKAPDLTIALPEGKQASLSSYKGKVVAVAFILST